MPDLDVAQNLGDDTSVMQSSARSKRSYISNQKPVVEITNLEDD